MVFSKLSWLGAAGLLSGVVNAQFPPTPEGVTVLKSQLDEGVTISYKEVSRCPSEISGPLLNITIDRPLRDNGRGPQLLRLCPPSCQRTCGLGRGEPDVRDQYVLLVL
jgi:hypothetical protein